MTIQRSLLSYLWLDPLDLPTLTLLFTLIVFLPVYFSTKKKYFTPLEGIPGPTPDFLFGNLRHTLLKHGTMHKAWCAMKKEYGGIFQLFLGTNHIVFVTDIEAIRTILRQPEIYDNDKFFGKIFAPIVPNTLVAIKGEQWKRHHRILSPTMSPQRMKLCVPKVISTVDHLLSKWKNCASKKPYEVQRDFELFSLEVLGDFAFGYQFNLVRGDDAMGQKEQDLMKAIHILFKDITRRMVTGDLLEKIVGRSSQIDWALNFIDEIIEDVQKTYSDLTSSGKDEDSLEVLAAAKNVVALISNSREQLSSKEVRDEMIGILFGYATTAATLAWAMKFISRNPRVQYKLREEIFEVIGTNGKPSYDDIQPGSMPYLDSLFKEIMRLTFTVNAFGRTVTQDTILNGMLIPQGTSVMVPTSVLHYNKDFWDNPDEIIPERWLETNSESENAKESRTCEAVRKGAYLPFGGGHRQCIGQRLATLEIKIFLCMFFQKFNLEKLPQCYDTDRQSIKLAVRPRESYILIKEFDGEF
ncbi:Cytochrome P450 3A4 [Basidiobolus ranarum]|uniref:Cytochrome P450 3A4 n=1 Tax=Basidiobolus ranarum TaxID=34480 RepID=A0ABR2WU84_9FUNG